jgi:hypothetical protein
LNEIKSAAIPAHEKTGNVLIVDKDERNHVLMSSRVILKILFVRYNIFMLDISFILFPYKFMIFLKKINEIGFD